MVRNTASAGRQGAAGQAVSGLTPGDCHQWRGTLHVIIGFAQLLMDEVPGTLNDEQRQCVSDILRKSQHLLEMVNALPPRPE